MTPRDLRDCLVVWSCIGLLVLLLGIRGAAVVLGGVVVLVVYRAVVARIRELRDLDGVPAPRVV